MYFALMNFLASLMESFVPFAGKPNFSAAMLCLSGCGKVFLLVVVEFGGEEIESIYRERESWRPLS